MGLCVLCVGLIVVWCVVWLGWCVNNDGGCVSGLLYISGLGFEGWVKGVS